jgi:drug/metabolite transporter (DMT)-like permease
MTTASGDRTVLAVSLIVGAVLLFSGSDAVLKAVSGDFSLWQIYTIRSVFSVPVLLALLMKGGIGRSFQITRPWVLFRSLLLVGAWLAYYTALPLIDLSIAAAAFYTSPLFIAGLSALFAGEPVGWRRSVALAMGFAGVLVILRPGADEFSSWTILPVAAAVFYALTALVTRTRCASDSPLVLGLAVHASLLVVGIVGSLVIVVLRPVASDPFLLGNWTAMDAQDWAVMAALGIAQGLASAAAARAYQSGSPVVIGTFDYAYLVFAAVWGMMFFSEDLGTLTLSGMALIVVAGLIALKSTEQQARELARI